MIFDPVGEKLKLIFLTALWVLAYAVIYSNITWTTRRISSFYKKFAWLSLWLLGTFIFSIILTIVFSQRPLFTVVPNNCTVMSYNKISQKMHATYIIDGIQYDGHTSVPLNDTDTENIEGQVLSCFIDNVDYHIFYLDKPLFLLYRPYIAAGVLVLSSTVNSVIFSSQLPGFCTMLSARRRLRDMSIP